MNIIDIQDQLKNFSENQLIQEMQAPSGSAPQFLVLSEIQRRKRVRDDFTKRQAAQEPTVAEEAVAAAGVPVQGIAGMSEAMAPQSAASSGIGTMMPEAMRQSASMPSPEEEAMAMRSGGLLSYGEELSQRMSQDKIDPFLDEVEQMADSRFGLSSGAGGLNKVSFDLQQLPGPRIPTIYPTPIAQPVAEPAYPIMPHAVKGGPIGQIMPAAMQASQFRGGSLSRYAEGGLLGSLLKGRDSLAEASKRPDIRKTKDGRMAMYRPGTNIFLGFVDDEKEMAEGGVLRAQQGMYLPQDPILRALMMQESGGDPMATGSVGEIGAFQIRPETALMPGYGIKSLFPEISAQIGATKKYKTASEAYKANKELIDSVLRDTKKAESFAGDYLGKAEDRLGSLESALLAYNRGISGAGKVEDPTQDPYYKGVMGFMDDNKASPTMTADSGLEAVLADRGMTAGDLFQQDVDPGLMSAMAASNQPAPQASSQNAVTQADIDAMLKRQQGLNLAPQDFVQPKVDPGLLAALEAQSSDNAFGTSGIFAGVERGVPSGAISDGKTDSTVTPTQPTTTTPPAATAKEEKTRTSNVKFLGVEDTGSSDIESEIKKLQSQMEKDREQDKWLAIAQAGLALMSSKEPTLLGAAGEAGVEGLKAFREAQDRYQEGVVDLINARAKVAKEGTKKGITASSAVSRINKIEELLNPTDPAAMPLDAQTRQRLEEEALYLRREILGYKDIVA
jgi:hypothetical protein